MPRTPEEKHRAFPNKEARYLCWGSRDKYFACLDEKNDVQACSSLRSQFEESCPATWVKYFERRRLKEEYNKKLQFGYDPVDVLKEKQ
ncbi:Cytochrome c oxidase subunit VIb [Trinorchestia longiramus]|nr:Cytochrome c oxidase subunit VIb [Trinorchestia longiramus]